MTGMSKASVDRKMTDGTFPKSFKIGESMSAWRVATIEQWIAEREQT
jgi:predicted DNA-binding transcriptional regulator AlpA